MTDDEQIIIYDTMLSIKERSPVLVELLNKQSTPQEREAYKTAIYAAVVRLGSLFTPEEHARHQERDRKMHEDLEAFFSGSPNGCKLSDDSWRGQTWLTKRTCRHEAFARASG